MFKIQDYLPKQLAGDFTKMFKPGMKNITKNPEEKNLTMKENKLQKEIDNMEENIFLLNTFQA
jgi:Skp family chaperone for outer membrane proteins